MSIQIDMFNNSDWGNIKLQENMVNLIKKKSKYVTMLEPKDLMNTALNGAIAYAKDKDKVHALLVCEQRLNDGPMKDSQFDKFIKNKMAESGIINKIKSKLGMYGVLEVMDFVSMSTVDNKYLPDLVTKLNELIVFPMYYGGKDKKLRNELIKCGFEDIKIGSKKYLLKLK